MSTPPPEHPAGNGPPTGTASNPPGPAASGPVGHNIPSQPTFSLPQGIFPTAIPLPSQGGQQQLVLQQVQAWQGPYPPPQHVKEYETILPGSFDRILKLAEQAKSAQIESVRTAQSNQLRDSQRGNYLGFLVIAGAMACSIVCAFHALPWIAAAFLSVPVMSVANKLIEHAKASSASSPQGQALQDHQKTSTEE